MKLFLATDKNTFYKVRKEGRRAYYSLSQKGKKISANVVFSFQVLDWTGWDNSWWGLAFSVPEQEKPLRHKIRTKLTAYRFAPLYNGFWVRPKHPRDSVIPLLVQGPLLPPVYLPDHWLGTEVRELFFEWDKKITLQAKPFWEHIFK